MDPASIPTARRHLDGDDRRRLEQLGRLVDADELDAAKDVAEELWAEATDAHRRLYQGIANALTAAIAHRSGHRRGAAEIAARTREMLEPYPRAALGVDLDLLLDTLGALLAGDAETLRLEG